VACGLNRWRSRGWGRRGSVWVSEGGWKVMEEVIKLIKAMAWRVSPRES